MSRLEFRVGVILEAEKHPEADNLYVEQIDCGDGAPRTVVSGLAGLIPLEELKGARVVVICNLKPATMKGVESKAMVLCASSELDGVKLVQIVTPPEGAPPGERVLFPGFEGEPETNPNAIKKKKIWETVAPDLKTNASCVATYRGVPFTTSKGPCTVASLADAPIK
ncbi:hypothetical protein T492DRAFT_583087 [Pavlovales sp. CCMP2436]|nr:hypothetical protein T492DRAFT_583087 [Pavlovales sp. CCMP2436]